MSNFNRTGVMKIHFIGIGGNGMSALAQIHAMAGDEVSGSDRLLDKGVHSLSLWENLRKLGVKFSPQDGSGVNKSLDAVAVSSAIEDDNPDLLKAKELKIKLLHRSELLAENLRGKKTIAVAGTSGKSTVTAMIFEILSAAKKSPSIIMGANSIALRGKGLWGNVYLGKSDIMVVEADESDGSFVNYRPHIGVLLNITKDHKELDVLFDYFRKFKPNCAEFLVNADEENLSEFRNDCATFGINSGQVRAQNVELDGLSCRFNIGGTEFYLPVAGLHNVQNAVAAVAVCLKLGVALKECVDGLKNYKGLLRRFNSVGIHNGIEVIDDFAHNPAKICATLATAHLRGKRVLAFYQPHGYAPVKLLKNELIAAFVQSLKPQDKIWFPEIYYIGGTTEKDVSSKDIVSALKAQNINAVFTEDKKQIAQEIARCANPGDVVVVMGARDPTLSDYVKSIFEAIKKTATA
ncbi:MAG: Mur ligase domain-containing protein [Elusimicrobia bacterium]|nr:Mur ligase domain-containing protein [Elusimicrobiota bacterium]